MIEEMGGDFLQWLRGFYFVTKRESVTQAAMEMGRNQPTISHQIKCLEDEFGVTLFDRSGGKMELTPEGQLFLQKAISIFEIIKEMKSETSDAQLEQEGKIVIAATHAIIHFFLPHYVCEFRANHPQVNFVIQGGGLEMVLGKIESSEADFGIANLPAVPETFFNHELFKTALKLIAPRNNPFFPSNIPTLKQISKAPFIFFPQTSTLTPFIEKTFSEKGLILNVVMILNNFDGPVKNRHPVEKRVLGFL